MANENPRMHAFYASICFCIIVPLLPLFISVLFHKFQYTELLLTAALYPISVFLQSRNQLYFALGIIILIFFSICLSQREQNLVVFWCAIVAITFVCIGHTIERYNMHVLNDEKFFNFK